MRVKKAFKCSICDYNCSRKDSLTKHIQSIHESKKPVLKCITCNYICATKQNLTRHMALVHDVKKSFKCTICGYNFTQKGSLNMHITSVHEGKKSFKCSSSHWVRLDFEITLHNTIFIFASEIGNTYPMPKLWVKFSYHI